MADSATVEFFAAVEEYVGRAIRPYAEKIASLEAKHAVELAELKARVSTLPDLYAQTEIVSGAVADAVAKLPPATPGKSVTVDELRPIVDEVVARSLASIPPPKAGDPGKDAVVDYDKIGDVIVLAVAKEVAKIPAPEPGKDATVDYAIVKEFVNAAAVNAVAAIPKPNDGKPVEPEVVRAMVETEVDRRVAAIPVPKNGVDPESVRMIVAEQVAAIQADVARAVAAEFAALPSIPEAVAEAVAAVPRVKGDPGRDFDPDLLRAEVNRAVSALPPPRPGEPGKDAEPIHPDTLRVMVREVAEELVAKAVAAIPPAKDGDSVASEDVQRMVDAEIGRQLEALLPYIKGEPGSPGFSPDDLQIEIVRERTLIVRLSRDGMPIVERSVRLDYPVPRGLYVTGQEYQKGDVVVYGGSSFVARCDTNAPLGGESPSADWQLFVKRGRDVRA